METSIGLPVLLVLSAIHSIVDNAEKMAILRIFQIPGNSPSGIPRGTPFGCGCTIGKTEDKASGVKFCTVVYRLHVT